MQTNGTQTKTACGIEYDPSNFPQRRDSPDPGEVIEAIERCGGVLRDAAEQVGCSETTLYIWAGKYDAIGKATEQNRTSIAFESRDRLVDLMRQDSDKRTAYKSATKLATMFDPRLDWSRRERREITRKSEKKKRKEAEKEVEDMDVDELLDKYNSLID